MSNRKAIIRFVLVILIGMALSLLMLFIYTSIPHRVRQNVVYLPKWKNLRFSCIENNNSTILIQFTFPNMKGGPGPLEFGTVQIFGVNAIPLELDSADNLIRERIATPKRNYLESILDSNPILFISSHNNVVEKYLAIDCIRFGILGSNGILATGHKSIIENISYDRISLVEKTPDNPFSLVNLSYTMKDNETIVVSNMYQYYLVTDDKILGNLAARTFPYGPHFAHSCNGLWLVENLCTEVDPR